MDIDHLDDVNKVKEILMRQNFFDIALLFVSPSGNGLKVVVPSTTVDEHEKVFRMYRSVLKEEMNIEVDASGKDLSRPCFVCYDPNVHVNLNYQFRKLDQYWDLPLPQPTLKRTSFKQSWSYPSGIDASPIKDFDKRGNIESMLLEHGWSVCRKENNKTHYTRPGKHSHAGPSCNVLHSINYLYVFTSSSKFEANRGYHASEVYAVLACDGNMEAANQELRMKGYGNQDYLNESK